eukprot:CAMPEP_0173457802 /NCGR_PEP_ID=MMETSP1357-20121228/58397_1 /TAXON_ID=77926 /ORGANISM="Hemiselmis rufescens, Strain PCC563" /LENGTH=107 /DNA_ID=CAMNT_0014425129 /DNA_START=125 /DNA_END=444 /DNA_ORIENTATION=-
MRLVEGVAKLTPVEFRFLHQTATTSCDTQARFQPASPNSAMIMSAAYAIHNAFICRPLLMQAGLAPHYSLEHQMKGEGGEDPRVMTAMDPLTVAAHPSQVAARLAQV